LRFRTTEHCFVTQCRFANSGGSGVRLDLRSMNNRVHSNEFSRLGGSGILVCGYGPGTVDLSKHNEILNNHVHDCARLYWHSAGIHLWQSGDNRVANNLIHDMPYSGIVVSGIGTMYMDHLGARELMRTVRWKETGEGPFTLKTLQPFLHSRNNLIERNEIYDVMKVMGDGNGIYVRFCSETGNVIRNNYVHDIVGRFSAGGIRCDGEQSGFLVTKNIIRNCTFAAFSSDGANEVTNNIFMDVFEQDPSEAAGTGPSATGGPFSPFYRGYIWHPGTGFRGSKIERNIFYHTGQAPVEFYDPPFTNADQTEDLRLTVMDSNIYFHSKNPAASIQQLNKIQNLGAEQKSIADDPLFVNPAKDDFRFRENSPARKLGIDVIDIDEIGNH
jgi:hypothetical protein